MTKDRLMLEHVVKLQQGLLAVQRDIDSHGRAETTWKRQVLSATSWIEKNCEITLGSPLAFCLEQIHTINHHEGPSQGNVQLIGEAISQLAKFIGNYKKKKAA